MRQSPKCGAPVGIFLAHGKGYRHYRGVITATSRPRPYKADRILVIGWRPAPVISFVPRQRGLRDLVSQAAVGNEVTSLFDTLKYWDGRLDRIALDGRNLPAIVHERPLKPKDATAKQQPGKAFNDTRISQQAGGILLDTHGEHAFLAGFGAPFGPIHHPQE